MKKILLLINIFFLIFISGCSTNKIDIDNENKCGISDFPADNSTITFDFFDYSRDNPKEINVDYSIIKYDGINKIPQFSKLSEGTFATLSCSDTFLLNTNSPEGKIEKVISYGINIINYTDKEIIFIPNSPMGIVDINYNTGG